MFTVSDELHLITRQLKAIIKFRKDLTKLMADADQVVTDLVSAIDGVTARVQEDVDALLAQIQELKGASEADKAALTATVEGVRAQITRLQGIDPVQPEVPDEPPVEPTP